MEKYSAYRDPGTGIQPFLTPVPPIGSDVLAFIALPFGYIIGVVRTAIVLALATVYIVLDNACFIFLPVPPLHRLLTRLLTALIARTILFTVGLFWIPVEIVTRKRRKGKFVSTPWNPSSGDIVISNWVSWIEVLWLAYRFNPVFTVPVFDPSSTPAIIAKPGVITYTPGRRTGTGSANIASVARAPLPQAHFRGFRVISLFQMVMLTGRVPPFGTTTTHGPTLSLEEIRSRSQNPVLVFPESTTSNGRGLLRFANVFPRQSVPVKEFGVFLMCVRYDPPTALTPSMALSIPYGPLSPLAHIFKLTTSLLPLTISIRLLDPSDSPSSQLFLVSEVAPHASAEEVFTEVCANLIVQLGKMKRTGMGWEDKAAFLEFYHAK